ncbi:AAA family ATPase [Candidatus Palauibacter sp.]|uniref:AAA family ATPase n=1 Tax=Candidatus Palauibacter sp. TaxID=3101350 RepID=UPI003AF2B516
MHRFENFKSFRDARIDLLRRPLTILIGPNGSGKTNALDAIEVLSTIASGRHLHEIADLGRRAALNVRGGLQACVRHGSETFGHARLPEMIRVFPPRGVWAITTSRPCRTTADDMNVPP